MPTSTDGTGIALRSPQLKELPAWPLFLLFAAFPIWWVLGLGAFAVMFCAVPMALLLLQRGHLEFPRVLGLWALFLAWNIASAMQLDAKQLVGFVVRFGNTVGCGVLFVYVFNARARLDKRAVLAALACFFAVVVFGGYLGVFLPHGSITTLAERLLPSSITSNPYVTALVHPSFAEIQQPYGSPVAFTRPSAPFPYTNSWGCNMALLAPLAIAGLAHLRTTSARLLLCAVLFLGIVPALTSLNRGMYIGLALAAIYVAVRLAARGRIVPLAGLLAVAVGGFAVAVASGFVTKLSQRLAYSQSNSSRSAIYDESYRGALKSPIFGNGAPQPSETVGVAVGSQGHIWNIMFSYGFIALGLFLMFFVIAWWTGRHAPEPGDLWISACLVVALASFVFYGFDGPQLAVVMTAAALSTRQDDGGIVLPRVVRTADWSGRRSEALGPV